MLIKTYDVGWIILTEDKPVGVYSDIEEARSVMEELERLNIASRLDIVPIDTRPLKFEIGDLYVVAERGTILTGWVRLGDSSRVVSGMYLTHPQGGTMKIKDIENMSNASRERRTLGLLVDLDNWDTSVETKGLLCTVSKYRLTGGGYRSHG